MKYPMLQKLLTFFIAGVWIINGLYCKILNGTPRHQDIVASILGEDYAAILTSLIGFSEIIMGIWVWSRFQSRLNCYLQITIVLLMNILEYFLVPDLLLWGKLNFFFALFFILLVYVNEFGFSKKMAL